MNHIASYGLKVSLFFLQAHYTLGLALLEREDYVGGIKELEKVGNYILTIRYPFSISKGLFISYTLFLCPFIIFVIYLYFYQPKENRLHPLQYLSYIVSFWWHQYPLTMDILLLSFKQSRSKSCFFKKILQAFR